MRSIARYAPVLVLGAAFSCNGGSSNEVGGQPASAQAVEWVGFHTEVPIAADDFAHVGAGLFGVDAQAGRFLSPRALSAGITLSSEAETAAPDQSRVRLQFDDTGAATGSSRTLALAPASFALGQLFLTATSAAVGKMHAQEQAEPGSGERFFLEYRVTSTQGGTLSLGLRGERDAYTLVVDVASPKTHLAAAQIGQAAAAPGAFDTVAGTVWFHLSRDEFRFFSDHAYGKGATGRQNFRDFHLVPFDWLRLTVEPHLDQKYVEVGFEVVSDDDKRVALAKAPASVLAGAQFQSLVDRNMTAMLTAERDHPGSSSPWKVPFYYDSPESGGVVQVVAEGALGSFQIAYAVESPRHALTDVPFVAYAAVQIGGEDPNARASCEMLGDPAIALASKGVFALTFSVSGTITASPDLKGPLRGTIYCSVFAATDVTGLGPRDGAMSLVDFQIADADLSSPTPVRYTTTSDLFAGDYQILCFQDLDGDGEASKGDPVTLPIGTYPVACNVNPVDVEFSLLDPS